jgi:hypothetical protein
MKSKLITRMYWPGISRTPLARLLCLTTKSSAMAIWKSINSLNPAAVSFKYAASLKRGTFGLTMKFISTII